MGSTPSLLTIVQTGLRFLLSLLSLLSVNLLSLLTPNSYSLFNLVLYLPIPYHSFFVFYVALLFVLI